MIKREEYIIQGGNRLKGSVKIDGAKNSALKLLSACLLSDQPIVLNNIPQLSDIYVMLELLGSLGSTLQFNDNTVYISTPTIKSTKASQEITGRFRASIGVLGPLLSRAGQASVALPGGCALGARPIDIHLESFAKMGAEVIRDNCFVHAKGALKPATLNFHFPSVGATENVMMAAVLTKGTTIINNAAREPEIVDLAHFLNAMGAQITGHGTSRLEIQGVDTLKAVEYTTMPDRLETVTFVLMALMTQGELTLTQTNREFIEILKPYCDLSIEQIDEGIRVKGEIKSPANIITAPYPGFPTDLQPLMMAALTQAIGRSSIKEALFENRFMLAPELVRMGAHIEVEGNVANIYGKTSLYGASVMAPDLRAGVSLVMAAMAATGETVLRNILHIDRGYASLDRKLAACGASILRRSQTTTDASVIKTVAPGFGTSHG